MATISANAIPAPGAQRVLRPAEVGTYRISVVAIGRR
jgi:hypothetical protein